MFFGLYFRHEQNQHPEEVTNTGNGIEANVHANDEQKDDEDVEGEDFVHNYHCARMTFGLLMMFFSDAVKRVIQQAC